MGLYSDTALLVWFQRTWAEAGVGELFHRMDADRWVECYQDAKGKKNGTGL